MTAVTLLWCACAHHGTTNRSYLGTIIHVEEPTGAYYSTAIGPTPVTRIRITLDPRRSTIDGPIEIVIYEAYRPFLHGKIGDRVQFHSSTALPPNRELSFRSIVDYRIVPQHL